MRNSAIFLSLLIVPFTNAQVPAADGAIVPFTTTLPACASLCGKLFDVQGLCTQTSVDSNCFCADARLAPFSTEGTAGVSAVCGAASCTAEADLKAIKDWFSSYCGTKQVATTTTSSGGAASTSTGTSDSSSGSGGSSGASNRHQTWLSSHYKWVIMLVVIFVFIVGAWVAACLLRRRYLRKKERQIEMRPPVAWGPHQLQGMTGGYNYGDGVTEATRGGRNHGRGFSKEAGNVLATPADTTKRESRSLRKKR